MGLIHHTDKRSETLPPSKTLSLLEKGDSANYSLIVGPSLDGSSLLLGEMSQLTSTYV